MVKNDTPSLYIAFSFLWHYSVRFLLEHEIFTQVDILHDMLSFKKFSTDVVKTIKVAPFLPVRA